MRNLCRVENGHQAESNQVIAECIAGKPKTFNTIIIIIMIIIVLFFCFCLFSFSIAFAISFKV